MDTVAPLLTPKEARINRIERRLEGCRRMMSSLTKAELRHLKEEGYSRESLESLGDSLGKIWKALLVISSKPEKEE